MINSYRGLQRSRSPKSTLLGLPYTEDEGIEISRNVGNYLSTRRNIPEDVNRQQHRHENLISRTFTLVCKFSLKPKINMQLARDLTQDRLVTFTEHNLYRLFHLIKFKISDHSIKNLMSSSAPKQVRDSID